MPDDTTAKRRTGSDAEMPQYAFSADLVTLSDGRPTEAEAIRTIRTHMIARHIEDGRRGIAICGAQPGTGCSFTAVNLAVSLSQVGIATLLIDANLRAPSLEKFIRPQAEVEARRVPAASPMDLIHAEVLPNLSLLYAGAVLGGDELMGGEGFRRLMDRCLRDFEFTIVDTPPVSESSDALRVASIIGYALVVARTHVTLIKDVANLTRQLREDGARVVGGVLNEV